MDVASLGPEAARTIRGPRHPLLALGAVLVLALGLRLAALGGPLQQDEFGPLYAVAGRDAPGPGLTPPASAPLLPVHGLAEVSRRSVLPYGIRNPLPLYHDLLYLVIRVLPVAVWSLRLPSVLAGVGCVAAMYALGCRCAGPAAGLAAALFTAVEPSQVALSALARPYALDSLACVLSFLALLALVRARRRSTAVCAAVGFGLTLALLGYTNPVLLLVGAAQAGVVAFVLVVRPLSRGERPGAGAAARGLLYLAGCGLAALLLLPERGYLAEVSRFAAMHGDYLRCFGPPRLVFFVLHNSPLAVAFGAGAVVLLLGRSWAGLTAAGGPGRSAGMGANLLGWPWLVVPQAAAVLVYLLRGQSVCLSRYFSYATLGGLLVLAAWATRARRPGFRLALPAVMAAALGLWGIGPVLRPFYQSYLLTDTSTALHLEQLRRLEDEGLLRPGDAILVRSGFLEADFLPDGIAPSARPEVEAACVAPLLTVCPVREPRPFVVLSLSEKGARTGTSMGPFYDPARFYDEELASRLRPHPRFWLVGPDWDRRPFLVCFLPWLANALGSSLRHSELGGVSLIERLPPGPVSPPAPAAD